MMNGYENKEKGTVIILLPPPLSLCITSSYSIFFIALNHNLKLIYLRLFVHPLLKNGLNPPTKM